VHAKHRLVAGGVDGIGGRSRRLHQVTTSMISFDAGKGRFNLRAAAIIIDGTRVLLHTCEGDDFWTFPGGRVEAGEVASATVERELREELDERVTCGDLIWLVENFFVYRGVPHHELGLYFRARLAPESRLLSSPGPFVGAEAHTPLTFAWFERAELASVAIRPSFVAGALAQRELEFRHIVQRDAPS
jgi:8-oxo-dGTP pyrophosphatase MutT (NUDIX family)